MWWRPPGFKGSPGHMIRRRELSHDRNGGSATGQNWQPSNAERTWPLELRARCTLGTRIGACSSRSCGTGSRWNWVRSSNDGIYAGAPDTQPDRLVLGMVLLLDGVGRRW